MLLLNAMQKINANKSLQKGLNLNLILAFMQSLTKLFVLCYNLNQFPLYFMKYTFSHVYSLSKAKKIWLMLSTKYVYFI